MEVPMKLSQKTAWGLFSAHDKKTVPWIAVGLIVLFAVLLSGCSQQSKPLYGPPEIEHIILGDGSITLTGLADRLPLDLIINDQYGDNPDYDGFNVYCYTDSVPYYSGNSDLLKPHLVTPTPVKDTTYTIQNLTNGIVYYIHITNVMKGGEITYPYWSNQVQGSSRPEGWQKLNELHAVSNVGFSFASGVAIDSSLIDADIYLVLENDKLRFKSPNQRGIALKHTDIKILGKAGFEDIFKTDSLNWFDSAVGVEAIEKYLYALRTQEENYVKVYVDSVHIAVDPKDTYVRFRWAYQLISGYPYF